MLLPMLSICTSPASSMRYWLMVLLWRKSPRSTVSVAGPPLLLLNLMPKIAVRPAGIVAGRQNNAAESLVFADHAGGSRGGEYAARARPSRGLCRWPQTIFRIICISLAVIEAAIAASTSVALAARRCCRRWIARNFPDNAAAGRRCFLRRPECRVFGQEMLSGRRCVGFISVP